MRPLYALICFGLIAATGILGCAGSNDKKTTVAVLRLDPPTASLRPGQTVRFTAFTSGFTNSLIWTASGGTISADGTFTAPVTQGNYLITARPRGIDGVVANAVASVVVPTVAVSLPTRAGVVVPKSKVPLSATLTGLTGGVTWSMEGTTGTVSGDGIFTAPTSPGSYTVLARSIEDPSITGRLTINVVNSANVRFSFAGKGDVVLSLNLTEAPNTSANLVSLVNKGFYDGIWVHRVDPSFVVQWGDPNTIGRTPGEPGFTPGTGGPGYTIPFETNSLTHTKYALGMARSTSLDSGGSQIYICLEAQPGLNGSYVVFGTTIAGQSVVDSLAIGDTIIAATTELPAP